MAGMKAPAKPAQTSSLAEITFNPYQADDLVGQFETG